MGSYLSPSITVHRLKERDMQQPMRTGVVRGAWHVRLCICLLLSGAGTWYEMISELYRTAFILEDI